MKRYHDETRYSAPLLDWKRPLSLQKPYPLPPLAREGDPVTSHLAGEAVAATSRGSQCAELLRAINSSPGHIAAFYIGLLDIEGGWRRCSDLVARGQAHYSGTQVNTKTGGMCGRLWPGRGPT